MKFLKKLLFLLFSIVVLLVISYWIVSKILAPTYEGELKLEGLKDKVTVFYDDNGVPHINAENQEDAYIAFGYVHAQDRLWQMELLRRIAAGRLSEVFGEKLVGTDMFFSSLGIEEAATKEIEKLDTGSKPYKMAMAYLSGINQFIKNGTTPLEFYLVGLEKETYTIEDMYNVFGYMAFSFASAHKTEPLVNEIKEKLGSEYVRELGIPVKREAILKNAKIEQIQAQISDEVAKIMETLPVPAFIGSNSWVLGPTKTKNGKVILANDPHIGFAQPSVWYQNHIKTPDYEMYGFNLALTPFPLLGHNKTYAYGLTMLKNDDTEFYLEEDHPSDKKLYKTVDGYKKYQLISRTVKVKDGVDTTFQVRVSQHGPIMNDVLNQIEDTRPIAMQWIYTRLPNKLLDVSYGMSHAESLTEFRNGVAKIHAPGLNVMYGDAKNNVAWFGAAQLYEYRDSINTKVYLNGASGEDEIKSFVSFDENPQAINPDWGYVYSANNQPDSVRGKLYPGHYLPENRARQITSIINPKNDFSSDDVAEMIVDVNSMVVKEVIENATNSIKSDDLTNEEKEVWLALNNWNGAYEKKQIGPTIYNRFIFEFLKNTFKDEMGERVFDQFMKGIPLQKKIIAVQMERGNSVWWDNISTKDIKENKGTIVTTSFKDAVKFLNNQLGKDVSQWHWEKVMSVTHEHPIGKAGGLLAKFFNVGPFKTNGGNEVINNHIFALDSTGIYKVIAGPSTRRVVDFSDIENSRAILPTGQSGNRFSRFYKDQANKYLNGQFVRMNFNPQDYEKSTNKLEFLPK